MRNSVKVTISALLGLVIFVWVVFYIGIKEIIASLLAFSWPKLLLIIAFFSLSLLIMAYRWKLILRTYGFDPPLWKLFLFRISGYGVSFLTPAAFFGGEPVRAYLLKKSCHVPVAEGASSVILDKMVEFTTVIFLGFVGLLYLSFNKVLSVYTQIFLTFIFLVGVVLMFVFYYSFMNKKYIFSNIMRFLGMHKIKVLKNFEKKTIETENYIMEFFTKHKHVFLNSLLLSLAAWIVYLAQTKLIIYLMGYYATYLQVFLILVFSGIAFIVPIPAAFGVLEGTEAALFAAFGLTATLGVAFTIILRGRDIVLSIIGLFFIWLFRRKPFPFRKKKSLQGKEKLLLSKKKRKNRK